MKLFLDAWRNKYDSNSYPRDFYFQSLKKIKHSSSPDELANHIIGLLYWKDKKVVASQKGNFVVDDIKYYLSGVKPNTYNPEKHKGVLISQDFFEWAKVVIESNDFDASKINKLTGKPFNLWNDGMIVIPAFILHILSPTNYPLYDQHVERAKRALLAEGLNKNSSTLTVDTYIKYKQFFNIVLNESIAEINIESIKYVDEALWGFGKFLKESIFFNKSQQNHQTNNVNYRNMQKNRFTPDEDFKKTVMQRIKNSFTQADAMRESAIERGITLPDSYYKYPGSHIDRWRKQGF